jgi:hypothetical protein
MELFKLLDGGRHQDWVTADATGVCLGSLDLVAFILRASRMAVVGREAA